MQERFHATDPDKQAKQLDDFAQQGMEMFVEYMYEHFEEFKLLVMVPMGRSPRTL